LKAIRQHYNEELGIYNFHYKRFLDDTVQNREKVYYLRKVEGNADSSSSGTDEEDDGFEPKEHKEDYHTRILSELIGAN